MIHVERGDPPVGFAEKAARLAQRWVEERRLNPGVTAATFWNRTRPGLRAEVAELAERFRHKCGFCEARLEHVQSPHVEYYRPKGIPEYEPLMFDWRNWLISCGRCNESKWRHFPDCEGRPCLLDPTADEPEEHLVFHGQEMEGLTVRGRTTIRLLGLDRSPLSRERASWLVKVSALLLLACYAGQESVRIEGRRLLIWCLQEEAPFCAMTRAFLASQAPRLAHPARPHARVSEEEGVRRIFELVAAHRADISRLA